MWGYQDGVPCLGYICRMIQNNIIIFRVFNQSLFITNGIRPSFIVTVPRAHRFTSTHFHNHPISHARTFTRTHILTRIQFYKCALPHACNFTSTHFTHKQFHEHTISHACNHTHASRHATSTCFLTFYSVIGWNKREKKQIQTSQFLYTQTIPACESHEMLYSLLPFSKYFRKYFSLCVQGFAF